MNKPRKSQRNQRIRMAWKVLQRRKPNASPFAIRKLVRLQEEMSKARPKFDDLARTEERYRFAKEKMPKAVLLHLGMEYPIYIYLEEGLFFHRMKREDRLNNSKVQEMGLRKLAENYPYLAVYAEWLNLHHLWNRRNHPTQKDLSAIRERAKRFDQLNTSLQRPIIRDYFLREVGENVAEMLLTDIAEQERLFISGMDETQKGFFDWTKGLLTNAIRTRGKHLRFLGELAVRTNFFRKVE